MSTIDANGSLHDTQGRYAEQSKPAAGYDLGAPTAVPVYAPSADPPPLSRWTTQRREHEYIKALWRQYQDAEKAEQKEREGVYRAKQRGTSADRVTARADGLNDLAAATESAWAAWAQHHHGKVAPKSDGSEYDWDAIAEFESNGWTLVDQAEVAEEVKEQDAERRRAEWEARRAAEKEARKTQAAAQGLRVFELDQIDQITLTIKGVKVEPGENGMLHVTKDGKPLTDRTNTVLSNATDAYGYNLGKHTAFDDTAYHRAVLRKIGATGV